MSANAPESDITNVNVGGTDTRSKPAAWAATSDRYTGLSSFTARANVATGARSTRTRTAGPHSFHSTSAGGSFHTTGTAPTGASALDNTLARLHPRPEQRGQPFAVRRRVAERELIE